MMTEEQARDALYTLHHAALAVGGEACAVEPYRALIQRVADSFDWRRAMELSRQEQDRARRVLEAQN